MVTMLHADGAQDQVQRSSPAADRQCVPRAADRSGHLRLECIDVRAHGREPVRRKRVVDQREFIAAHMGHGEINALRSHGRSDE